MKVLSKYKWLLNPTNCKAKNCCFTQNLMCSILSKKTQASQMLEWTPASSGRQKRTQLLFLFSLSTPSQNLQMALPSTSDASLCSSSWLPSTRYGCFLCSLSVKWMLALPVDLWLTMFKPVYNAQIKGVLSVF